MPGNRPLLFWIVAGAGAAFLVLILGVLIAALLSGGGSGDGSAAATQGSASTAPGAPRASGPEPQAFRDDLVPGDAQLFFHLRVADILNTELGRGALANLADLPNGGPFGEMARATGLEPTDIEAVTFAGIEMDKEIAWVIVTFRKTVDREKLYNALGFFKHEASEEGKSFDVLSLSPLYSGGLAVYWASDRVAVLSPVFCVKRYLSTIGKHTSGPMDGAIARASEKHSLVVGVVVPPEARGKLGAGPWGLAGAALDDALQALESGTVIVDFETITKVEAAGRVADEVTAQRLKGSLDKWLERDAHNLIEAMRPVLAVRAPPGAGAVLVETAEGARRSAKVSQDGPRLTLQTVVGMPRPWFAFFPFIKDAMKELVQQRDPDATRDIFGLAAAAHRQMQENNIKQLILGLHNYHDTLHKLPDALAISPSGTPLLSWRVAILPYIEEEALYRQFHLNESWDSPHNKALLGKMPSAFARPGGPPGETKTAIGLFTGPNTWYPDGRTAVHIKDMVRDASNTVLLAEAAAPIEWTRPDNMRLGPGVSARSLLGHQASPNKYCVGLFDGSVRWLPLSISDRTLDIVINPRDASLAGPDW
jgi:hypothetical protein